MYLLFEPHCLVFKREDQFKKKNLTFVSHSSGSIKTEPAFESSAQDGLIEVHMTVFHSWFTQWQANLVVLSVNWRDGQKWSLELHFKFFELLHTLVTVCPVLRFLLKHKWQLSLHMLSLTIVLQIYFYFMRASNVPNARRQMQQQNISWKKESFALSGPCPQFPTTSPSSLPPKPPPLHLFSLCRKTGEREDDVWQMPYFDFLSGRLILTQCVSYQGHVDCVCCALISLSSAQPLFS